MKIKNLLFVLIMIAIGFTGCRKEGCTDPDAIN